MAQRPPGPTRTNPVFRYPTLVRSLDERVADAALAGHADRVAARDRAAVDVERFSGDAELVAAIEHLHLERLVELPQPDVVHLEFEPFEQLRDSDDGAAAHFVCLGARERHADIAPKRLDSPLLGHPVLPHFASPRAVRKLAGVAPRDRIRFAPT